MLCTNGHNNSDSARFCMTCGVNTFHPGSTMPATSSVVYTKSVGPTNGLAIASLVLGIVWIFGITSVIALFVGYRARREIAATGESGDGLAIAGIVLGWIGVMGTVLYVVLLVLVAGAVHGVGAWCHVHGPMWSCP